MTIAGRLTADAAVTETKDGRKVVNFSVAVNDRYKTKDGEKVKVTTYFRCAYWLSEKMAQYLKKATLVELEGRLTVTPYVGKDGTAKASLNCHVRAAKILAWPKELTVVEQAVDPATDGNTAAEDTPL